MTSPGFCHTSTNFAVVQIGGDGYAHTVGGMDGFRGRRLPPLRNGRRDARPVETTGHL